MAISTDLIRRKLRSQLLTATGLPLAARRAWENRSFDPNTATHLPWLRETLLPGQEDTVSTGLLRAVGLVQYDLFAPKNTGTEAYEAIRDNIKAVFLPGTHIDLGNGHFLSVQSGRPLPQVGEDPWVGFPLQIAWEAYGTRS
jgi:hypothetical protein